MRFHPDLDRGISLHRTTEPQELRRFHFGFRPNEIATDYGAVRRQIKLVNRTDGADEFGEVFAVARSVIESFQAGVGKCFG